MIEIKFEKAALDAINGLSAALMAQVEGFKTAFATIGTDSRITPQETTSSVDDTVPEGASICEKCDGNGVYRKKECPICFGKGYTFFKGETMKAATKAIPEEPEETKVVELADLKAFGAEHFKGNAELLNAARELMAEHLKDGETMAKLDNLKPESYGDVLTAFEGLL